MSIIYSKTQDGTIHVLLGGKVSRDAEVKQTGNATRVKFSVAYGKKQYMDCEAFADSDVGAIAACLEKGDTIAVMGEHRSWEYNGKQYQSVSADMIFTMALPQTAAPPEQKHSAPETGGSYLHEIDDAEGELPF